MVPNGFHKWKEYFCLFVPSVIQTWVYTTGTASPSGGLFIRLFIYLFIFWHTESGHSLKTYHFYVTLEEIIFSVARVYDRRFLVWIHICINMKRTYFLFCMSTSGMHKIHLYPVIRFFTFQTVKPACLNVMSYKLKLWYRNRPSIKFLMPCNLVTDVSYDRLQSLIICANPLSKIV
jgi:hypothetical protein